MKMCEGEVPCFSALDGSKCSVSLFGRFSWGRELQCPLYRAGLQNQF